MEAIKKEYEALLEAAKEARISSYSPYSGFAVGAALLFSDGSLITGTNVENTSFGATMCAERVAIFKAISEGRRDFVAIAIVGGDDPCPPCGMCLQVLCELCPPTLDIVLRDGDNVSVHRLSELIPLRFDKNRLS